MIGTARKELLAVHTIVLNVTQQEMPIIHHLDRVANAVIWSMLALLNLEEFVVAVIFILLHYIILEKLIVYAVQTDIGVALMLMKILLVLVLCVMEPFPMMAQNALQSKISSGCIPFHFL